VCLHGKVGTRQISTVEEPESELSENEDELFVIEQVGTVKHNHKAMTTVECQLDTGATCNVKNPAYPPLQPETSQLKCSDNSIINTLGKCTLECNYHSKTYLQSY